MTSPVVTMGAWISLVAAASASAQTMHFEPVGSIPGPADLVRMQGDQAFVVAGTSFTVYDISNPETPKRQGTYTFPEEIWGFRLHSFPCLCRRQLLRPWHPRHLERRRADAHRILQVTRSDKDRRCLREQGRVHRPYGSLVMLDVSNEAEPVAAGSFFLDGYARDVTASGAFAYAVDSPSGLYVFDLSQPVPLEPVGVLHAPNAPHSMEVSEGSDASGPKLLCGAGRGNLQVYDVSDPTMPVKAATFATPGRAERVALAGNLAYVADGEAGIQVVDLSTPSQPKLVGTYETSGPARDVAVDSLVFVVVGDEEVLVLRQTP